MTRAASIGVSIAALAVLVWATLMWGLYPKDATGHGLPPVKGLTYEDATAECARVAEAELVECFVVPDGDDWQALPGS